MHVCIQACVYVTHATRDMISRLRNSTFLPCLFVFCLAFVYIHTYIFVFLCAYMSYLYMRMHVCSYLYMRMHVCMYIRKGTYLTQRNCCVFMSILALLPSLFDAYMCTYLCMYMCVCTVLLYACICIYVYLPMHVCMHSCLHIFACTYTVGRPGRPSVVENRI
jgi:hypothetical protein